MNRSAPRSAHIAVGEPTFLWWGMKRFPTSGARGRGNSCSRPRTLPGTLSLDPGAVMNAQLDSFKYDDAIVRKFLFATVIWVWSECWSASSSPSSW